jgi:uncharacterized damage-inducible protein DinB
MTDLLPDLFVHQAWADALHWRALEDHAAALEDTAIRERLHHIHLVQGGFLAVLRGQPFAVRPLEQYASLGELKAEARAHHAGFAALLGALSEAERGVEITIPWFSDPPCRISVEQALHQVVMHSQNHRGQNATRLRELGGKPPTTDLIVWYWKGRPAPDWR